MKLIFATNNRHKLDEVRAVLPRGWELLTPRDCGLVGEIPEEQDSLAGNALQKARYVFDHLGADCFADDTGLEVEALDGEPGVRSARYAGEACDSRANIDKLLAALERVDSRGARFRTVIALIMGGDEYVFEGEVHGRITRERYGDGGFGYDSVFIPDGYDVTFAQMDADEKNRISHRAVAVGRLAEFLHSVGE